MLRLFVNFEYLTYNRINSSVKISLGYYYFYCKRKTYLFVFAPTSKGRSMIISRKNCNSASQIFHNLFFWGYFVLVTAALRQQHNTGLNKCELKFVGEMLHILGFWSKDIIFSYLLLLKLPATTPVRLHPWSIFVNLT